MKFTVSPVVKPVPLICTVVPPLAVPDAGLSDVTAGTIGFHCQLICVMLTPQEPFSDPLGGLPCFRIGEHGVAVGDGTATPEG